MPSSSDRVPGSPPRATVIGAFLEGWRRVLRAPMLTLGVLALTVGTAMPLAIVLKASMERHLGSSVAAEQALNGWAGTWALEFASDTPGVARTFTYEILGFGGTLAGLSQLLDGTGADPALTAAVAIYLVLWTFLAGGLLDRLARGRAVRPEAFFGACGVFFLRFVRLAVPIGFVYWALFRWLRPLLFTTVYDRWTRDLASEHQVLILRGLLYAVFLAALAAVSVVSDFTKVRLVVEDRRSVVGALGAALRFVRRRPGRVLGLYLLNLVAGLVIARLWLQTAPAAAAPLWVAFLGGEIYVLARLWAKLAFMASEVVFFQGELAHASFTRAPEPLWPDSPAVEAIHNLRKRS